MAGKLDLHEVKDNNQISYTREALLMHSPMIVTYSEIEVMAPSNILTPSRQPSYSIIGGSDPTTTDVLTCSSTATDDMLDTVDDCVGCVNQISLQQDFEDSFRDVTLNLHHDSNGIPALSSDDETIDIAPNTTVSEIEPVYPSTANVCNAIKEEPPQYSEMDLLDWCSSGFHGVKTSQ